MMLNKEKLLGKIKEPEEKLAISKALNRASFCIKNYEMSFTQFLNPIRAFELIDFIKSETELNMLAFGGVQGCERQMLAFAPDYMEIKNEDFPICAVKISYESKFSKNLTHRDFLGSILGTGIVREKIGDIALKEGYAIAFVEKEIAEYLCINLERVSHTKVNAEIIKLADDFSIFSEMKEVNIIVSSMRLDAIVSAVFKISRGNAADIIKGGKVFVNWHIEESVSKNIVENSIITARGYGRAKIVTIEGKTKKDRIVVKIIKYT